MKEKDIRPANLMQKYAELSAKDAKYFFKDIPRETLQNLVFIKSKRGDNRELLNIQLLETGAL